MSHINLANRYVYRWDGKIDLYDLRMKNKGMGIEIRVEIEVESEGGVIYDICG